MIPFTAFMLILVASWKGIAAEDDEVVLELHNWFSTCNASDGGEGVCGGSTSQGLDDAYLDLSGNFFCYVNPVQETETQVFWFNACPATSGCDVAPLSEISVWTMYLNPNHSMYDSLVPTECVNGACSCETINPIRGSDWYTDTELSWCSAQLEEDPPYACSYFPPGAISYGECSISEVASTVWNSTYCVVQANMSAARLDTPPPTMSPTSSSPVSAWHWCTMMVVAALVIQSLGT